MVEYVLFGAHITFDNATERAFDLKYESWLAVQKARDQFYKWYQNCGRIEKVLNEYKDLAQNIIFEVAFYPLYKTLTQYDIYDMSQDTYWERCVDFSGIEQAKESISRKYNAIEGQRETEENYRAARKAGRSRWQGGGFGFSGAIKGAAMAGSMNVLSGMAHSAVNAVGNAGSSIAAANAKGNLYTHQSTAELLFNGIVEDIFSLFEEHTHLINEYRPVCIRDAFDTDRSSAMFENAKNIPSKRTELLCQALTLCPWNADLVIYIFLNFPKERRTVSALAKRFHVDLSGVYEDLLKREYTDKDRVSEDAAQQAKARIRTLMQEYGISESETFDQLERDCLERICHGYEKADKETCFFIQGLVKNYDALAKNKAPYLEKIQKRIEEIWISEMQTICAGYENADEETCNNLIHAIQTYDAPNEQKEEFLQKLKERIEEIWSSEDNAEFEKLYLATDITDPVATQKTLDKIRHAARTSNSDSYISALESCTEKNIHKARIFQRGIRPRLYAVIGWTIFLLGISNLFFLHQGVATTILCTVVSFIVFGIYVSLSDPWEKLTLKGTVLHPVLTSGIPKARKGIPPFVIALLISAVFSWVWINDIPSKIALQPDNTSSHPAKSNNSDFSSAQIEPDYSMDTTLSGNNSVGSTQSNNTDLLNDTLSPGTYQIMIGRSGILGSISIFQHSESDTWYCNIITWSPYDRGSDIADDYYGPAILHDPLHEVVCGDYTFKVDDSGQLKFDESLVEMSYDITRYSDAATGEETLNALIARADSMAPLSLPQSAVNHYIELHDLNFNQVNELAAYYATDEQTLYSVFSPDYYDYTISGSTSDLAPTNPDHVYNVKDDLNKSDDELSNREFEQRYGYSFGYCEDFGKTHAIGSDPG